MEFSLAFRADDNGTPLVSHYGHVLARRETEETTTLGQPWRSLDIELSDRMERRCYRLANCVHVVSTALVAETRSRALQLPRGFFQVRALGIDVHRFSDRSARMGVRASLGIRDEDCAIATVSRLVRWKQVDWLVEAMRRLPQSCHLIVVGDGDQANRLRDLARAVPDASRIHFLGHTDPVPALAAADVFALPSRIESFGVVYAEAMCMGLPCVGLAYRPPDSISTAQDVISPNFGGFVVDDQEQLEAALRTLAEDPAVRLRMGQHARQRAQSEYSAARYAEFIESQVRL